MILNAVTIALFAGAAITEAFALNRTDVTTTEDDDGYTTIRTPDEEENRRHRALTTVALILTTAGGFVSLWAPGFAE